MLKLIIQIALETHQACQLERAKRPRRSRFLISRRRFDPLGSMQSYLLFGCIMILSMTTCPSHSISVNQSSQNIELTETLSPEDMRSDFDFMRSILEEAHAGLYRYVTKSEMNRAFDEARAKLSRPMTKIEFLMALSEVVAKIRCGHTHLYPNSELDDAMKSVPKFPLRVILEGKRVKVLLNDTPSDKTLLPGMEILEVSDHKVSDIMKRVGSLESDDGDIVTGKRKHFENNFAKYYFMIYGRPDEYVVKAKDATGKVVIAKLSGVTDADRRKNQNLANDAMMGNIKKIKGDDENLSLRFIQDPEIALIRIHYFVGDDFPGWIENAFKILREKGVKTLILDLRGNGGGNDNYGASLVSYLIDKPFRYFDRILMKTISPSPAFKEHSDWIASFEKNLRFGTTPNPKGGYFINPQLNSCLLEQSPSEYAFSGRTMVLIDGGTFSTAADFCAIVHHLKRATFIGEETGGGYYGNNSGILIMVTLPRSKFQLRVPMYEYWNAVSGDNGERRGTRPDYPVEIRFNDLLRGVDAPLACAVKLASETSK